MLKLSYTQRIRIPIDLGYQRRKSKDVFADSFSVVNFPAAPHFYRTSPAANRSSQDRQASSSRKVSSSAAASLILSWSQARTFSNGHARILDPPLKGTERSPPPFFPQRDRYLSRAAWSSRRRFLGAPTREFLQALARFATTVTTSVFSPPRKETKYPLRFQHPPAASSRTSVTRLRMHVHTYKQTNKHSTSSQSRAASTRHPPFVVPPPPLTSALSSDFSSFSRLPQLPASLPPFHPCRILFRVLEPRGASWEATFFPSPSFNPASSPWGACAVRASHLSPSQSQSLSSSSS